MAPGGTHDALLSHRRACKTGRARRSPPVLQPMKPPKRLMDWVRAFGRLQISRPWIILGIALVSTTPALIAARGLGLKTDFSEVLPDNKPSVIEMRRVSERLAAASTLMLAVEVPRSHPEALE